MNTKTQTEKEDFGRRKTQELIIARHGLEAVESAKERYCVECIHSDGTECFHRLIPLTFAGQPCPYYKFTEVAVGT